MYRFWKTSSASGSLEKILIFQNELQVSDRDFSAKVAKAAETNIDQILVTP